jgi:hypothetical protein
MADQDLLTIFVALTAVAVVIQAGIVSGLYYVSNKLNRQVDRAMRTARDLSEPAYRLAENLRDYSVRVAELSGVTRGEMHDLSHRIHRTVQ